MCMYNIKDFRLCAHMHAPTPHPPPTHPPTHSLSSCLPPSSYKHANIDSLLRKQKKMCMYKTTTQKSSGCYQRLLDRHMLVSPSKCFPSNSEK